MTQFLGGSVCHCFLLSWSGRGGKPLAILPLFATACGSLEKSCGHNLWGVSAILVFVAETPSDFGYFLKFVLLFLIPLLFAFSKLSQSILSAHLPPLPEGEGEGPWLIWHLIFC